MEEIESIQRQVAAQLGEAQALQTVEGGFSAERKFRFLCGGQEHLLRIAAAEALAAKRQEFEVMERLYAAGVRCNRPVRLFEDGRGEQVYSVFHYLPGAAAESALAGLTEENQYDIGLAAGRDLRQINRLERRPANWKARRWRKHERIEQRYREEGYRIAGDEAILAFVRAHYDSREAEADCLLHDDFHLGNIIIHDGQYGGVIDFNRYDWGDPLHEWVKLEWFTWSGSPAFARGQAKGYWQGEAMSEGAKRQFCVYLAMSLFSTLVWTRRFFPETLPSIEEKVGAILARYEGFARIDPVWSR